MPDKIMPGSQSLATSSPAKKRSAMDNITQGMAKRPAIQSTTDQPASSVSGVRDSVHSVEGGLSLLPRNGALRYVNRFHWSYFSTNAGDCQKLTQEEPRSLSSSKIVVPAMLGLLKNMPDKPVTDVLIELFSLTVHPILEIVPWNKVETHFRVLDDWRGSSTAERSDMVLTDDLTFLGIIWAVLYCGATAAPFAVRARLSMNEDDLTKLANQLERNYQTTMGWCEKMCNYPTEYTLAASSLHYSIRQKTMVTSKRLEFVARMVREAQFLHLNQPIDPQVFASDEIYWRQTLWLHIMFIDLQTAKAHGLAPVLPYLNQAGEDRVAGEIFSRTDSISISLILALCRYEATRIEICNLDAGSSSTQVWSDRLYGLIERVIRRIPGDSIPEKGLFNEDFINIEALADYNWYRVCHQDKPCVTDGWIRLALAMIRYQTDIGYHKAIILKVEQAEEITWHKLVEACAAYLQVWMHLKQTTCYFPFVWSLENEPPLQIILCLLKYVEHRKASGDTKTQLDRVAKYYVKEAGNIMDKEYSEGSQGRRDFIAGWQFLKKEAGMKKAGGTEAGKVSNRMGGDSVVDTVLTSIETEE